MNNESISIVQESLLNRELNFADTESGAGDEAPAGNNELAAAENKSDDRLGKGYTGKGDSKKGGLKNAIGRNRGKGLAIGGGTGGVIIALVFGFGSLVSLEIETIAKDLLKYEAKAEQSIEDKAARKIMSEIFCRRLAGDGIYNQAALTGAGCQNKNQGSDDEDSESEQAAEDDLPLAKNLDEFDFTDPSISEALSNQGITVNVKDGNFAGLTDDTTGQAITADDIANDDALFARIENAIPEWSAGQLTDFRNLMIEHVGATFDPATNDPNQNADEEVDDDVLDGNNGTDPTSLPDDGFSNEQPTPTQAGEGAYQQAVTEGGALGDAIEVVNKDLSSGTKTGAQAIADGKSAFASKLGSAAFISSVVAAGCSAFNAANHASTNRSPTIMKLLTRHFTTVISLASEISSGNANGKEVGQLVQLFNGDGTNQDYTGKGPPPESSQTFSNSAAWQRVIGNSPNTDPTSSGYNPDIETADLPNQNTGNRIVNDIDNVMRPVGGTFICAAEGNRWLGGVVNTFVGGLQFFADDFSLGTAQILIAGGVYELQNYLQNDVVPDILNYFTPVGLFGHEDSVQWMDNADAGGNLAFNDYSRRLGGEPLTNKEADSELPEEDATQADAENATPWFNRVLSPSNPSSVLARVVVSLPLTRVGAIFDAENFFSNLPREIGGNFASIFNSKVSAATPAENPGVPYGLTQYGFLDSDISPYDPIANEQYLNTTITYNGKTESRIDLLGDPNNYPNGEEDPSSTDILHCFTDSSEDGQSPSSNYTIGNNDPSGICQGEGNYDYVDDPPCTAGSTSDNLCTPDMSDSNVAISYCMTLSGSDSPACLAYMTNIINDDLAHFREYLLDTQVMDNYTSLTSNQ